MNGRVYVCDDEEGMRRYLQKMLASWGLEVATFAGPLLLLQTLRDAERRPDLLLLDVKMAELDGIETLRRIKQLCPELTVLIMTGYGTIESAVEAMKLGAFNYLTKPFPQEKLFAVVRHCLEREPLLAETVAPRRERGETRSAPAMIYASARFGEIHDLALRVAKIDSPVLILGESGTGKEMIAALVHAGSPRRQQRLLALNCAALTETLLESQLFGHLKGAFTGALQNQKGLLEEAHGGTLFLDEVAELSPALQAKLLRVLQEGEFIPVGATLPKKVDVRFIAATNKQLEGEVAAGRFREDLFYRLNVITLPLPPLRERPEDIDPLTGHFLTKVAAKFRQPVKRLSAPALAALKAHHWPGNVRELENVIERGVAMATGDEVGLELLPLKFSAAPPRPAEPSPGPAPLVPLSLRETEKRQVQRVLHQTRWNKTRAAATLGVTRKTLDKKIRDFDLSPDGEPTP